MNLFDYLFEDTKDLEKDFVIGNGEIISYSLLYDKSLKFASYLIDKVGTNQNIIIISQNSINLIIAYLGILKSGNVIVPLDYSLEQENFNFISSSINCSLLICSSKVSKNLDLNNIDYLIEDELINLIADQEIRKFQNDFVSDRLAEIIFTSGSTGKPKGVMLSHQNIISNTDSILKYLRLNRDDIVLVVLPFYYCFGLSLLHSHLKVGGQIVLNNSFMFLSTVINDLKEFNCTSFSGVPSHYQMLLKKSKTFKNCSFPSLKYVTQAGGKLHDNFIREFVENFTGVKFFVMYGQTEATARLSYLEPELVIKKIGSIGRAIPGVTLKVVDKNLQEVEKGEVGQIIAKGKNIMKGYFKDPQSTDLSLRDGWLITGDLARVDGEGFIYIVGREKEIIKVGGKRVSPKEIESVIMKVSGVIDCSIEAIDDDVLSEGIKAVVVRDKNVNDQNLKRAILRRCKTELSIYKIPKVFEFTDVLITKVSGKK
ncbi:AMP-binding protein [Lutimonas zeaxanthinifaciens]|uniref:AMP-binding protein n=1 Tax=Lutimonas zeaxanthinifaciens TaxID=3060215 RepID=UPI00265D0565|nr:AMP-binding protein [Lutimonas sp. YSD2104]WKK66828.1 AMP-binding protein [Lutimonas sp. YSD2104]